MHVLILAAGFGTRLKKYGENIPKGLIPMEKETLFGKIADELSSHSLTAVTNDRFFPAYTQWLTDHGKEITLLNDGARDPDHRLGALGDILFAVHKNHWENDDLLVIPSDTYYEFSIEAFIKFAQEKGSFATVVRKMSADQIANRLGCAVVENDRITDFVEKPSVPPSDYAAIPFYYYPKQTLALLSDYKGSGGNMDAPGSIIPWLLTKGVSVYAFVTEGETLDVGTTADVEKLAAL